MNTAISFRGLNDAQVFEKGNPIKPGTYDLKLKRLIAKKTFNKGDALIAEFEVLCSYGHPEVREGDSVSYFQKLIDPSVALPAIKSFLIAVLGYDYKTQKAQVDKEISPQLEGILKEALDTGVLSGSKVHASAFQKKTKAGGDFTFIEWSPLTGD